MKKIFNILMIAIIAGVAFTVGVHPGERQYHIG